MRGARERHRRGICLFEQAEHAYDPFSDVPAATGCPRFVCNVTSIDGMGNQLEMKPERFGNGEAGLPLGARRSRIDAGPPDGPSATSTPTGLRPSASRVRPIPMSELVSRQMSRMPRRNTKPELALRRELHARGLRFRIHPALPGRPDVAFTRAKIAVFVDGCFWHGCSEHGTLPKNNREWWRAKIAGNARRDRAKDEALMILGWDVLHFWEHEGPAAAANLVEETWRRKTLRPRVEP